MGGEGEGEGVAWEGLAMHAQSVRTHVSVPQTLKLAHLCRRH
jgi:hypothetical protein